VRAGQVVLSPGRALRPQEIAMPAPLGPTQGAAIRRPPVALLAPGGGPGSLGPNARRCAAIGTSACPGAGPQRGDPAAVDIPPAPL